MIFLRNLEKNINFWFLLIISIVFFFLRFPSLFEPYWYGDEGIYQALGLAIRHGALLYRDTFDNKPPLLYLLYAFFNSDQDIIRFFSLLTGVISIFLFFFLAKKLFTRNFPVFISTTAFAIIFGLPVIEGNIANAENFIIPLNLAAALLIYRYSGLENKTRLLFISGFILSFAFLFKIVAIFDFAAFLTFLLFVYLPHEINKNFIKKTFDEIRKILPLIIGFFIPIFLVTLFFLINNSFSQFLTASLFSNVGYVGYGNKFLIPQGFLIFKLLLLVIFLVTLFLKRVDLKFKSTYFVLIWFAFSLFNAYFSQRPYTHYLLSLLPAFSLMIGLILWNKRFFKLILVFLMASFLITINSFWIYTKIIPYYENFISFNLGKKTLDQYRRYFDKKTVRDYDLAIYLNANTNKNDKVYIWGNNAQVYKLINKAPIEKYTVAYHVLGYKDGREITQKAIEINKPKFIVIVNDVPSPPFSLESYMPVINIQGALVYERHI